MKRSEIIRMRKTADAMLARVYLYLNEEYRFMRMYNTDNCNLWPLTKCKERTAKATGRCLRAVTKALVLYGVQQQRYRQPRKKTKKNLTKVSPKKRIVKKNKNDINKTKEQKNDIKYTDSSANASPSNSHSESIIIEISDQEDIDDNNQTDINQKIGFPNISIEKEEHVMLSFSPTNIAKEDQTNQRQIAIFEDVVADNSDQVNVNTAIDNNVKEFPSTSIEQAEYNILPSSTKYPADKNKRQLRPNLRRTIQFEDEITESSDQIDSDTVTDMNKKPRFPSTFAEQVNEIPLSNQYSENEDEKLRLRPNLCQFLQFEDEELTETETNIIQRGFASPSIKQEEYDILSSSNTCADLNTDGGLNSRRNLHPVLKFEDEAEIDTDSNVERVEHVEFQMLPLYNTDARNVMTAVEFEDEQEIDAVSNMEEDCYVLESNIDLIDVSDTSDDQNYYLFEDLPSSSRNHNLYKANETKDIQFICIKNEVHSDSSDSL